MNDQIKMQLSAFVDGELSDAESELLVRRISRDADLRDQIAEYQAMGRIMRGEYSVRVDGLLDRVNVGIESDLELKAPPAPPRVRSFFRPAAGLAMTAAVAMVALVGYGQLSGDVRPTTASEQYTVPSPDMREYYLRHGELATGFNTRVVTLQLREEALEEHSAEAAQTIPDDRSNVIDDVTEPEVAAEEEQSSQDVTIEP